jgi:hypothetical protein
VYSDELRRVLKPGGKLLLRASLRTAGMRNDINEAVIGAAFAAWRVEHMERAAVPSDTRMLEVIIAYLATTRPARQRTQHAPAESGSIITATCRTPCNPPALRQQWRLSRR